MAPKRAAAAAASSSAPPTTPGAKRSKTTSDSSAASAAKPSKSVSKASVSELETLVATATHTRDGQAALSELVTRYVDASKSTGESEEATLSQVLRRCFTLLAQRKHFLPLPSDALADEVDLRKRLVDRFEIYVGRLLEILAAKHEEERKRVSALRIFMTFVVADVFTMVSEDDAGYSLDMHGELLLALGQNEDLRTTATLPRDPVLRCLKQDYIDAHYEIRYNQLLLIKRLARDEEEEVPAEALLTLLRVCPAAGATGEKTQKKYNRALQSAWVSVLRREDLPLHSRPTVLKLLPALVAVLPQPLMLADYLVEAFDEDSSELQASENEEISMLALSSLVVLMRDHGLDYPNFYTRLYVLASRPTMFYQSQQVTTFLPLLDVCLSSTHLPSQLVASFAKRLTRSALFSPPTAGLFVVPFVRNLLQRHPECLGLIQRSREAVSATASLERDEHREEASKLRAIQEASRRLAMGMASSSAGAAQKIGFVDPFDEHERDPTKTNALESCLWELLALERHYVPTLSRIAKSAFKEDLMSARFQKAPMSIHDFTGVTMSSLFANEAKSTLKAKSNAPVAYPLNVELRPVQESWVGDAYA